MTFTLPFRLTPDQAPKDIVNGTQQDFEAVTAALNTNSFKIAVSGTAIIPAATVGPPYTSSVIITHNLGYIPVVIAYLGATSALSTPLPTFDISFNATTATINSFLRVGLVNKVTATINYDNLIQPSDTPIKYYLLQETTASST